MNLTVNNCKTSQLQQVSLGKVWKSENRRRSFCWTVISSVLPHRCYEMCAAAAQPIHERLVALRNSKESWSKVSCVNELPNHQQKQFRLCRIHILCRLTSSAAQWHIFQACVFGCYWKADHCFYCGTCFAFSLQTNLKDCIASNVLQTGGSVSHGYAGNVRSHYAGPGFQPYICFEHSLELSSNLQYIAANSRGWPPTSSGKKKSKINVLMMCG